MSIPKIGLLPFYLMLYDEKLGYMRPRVEAFYKKLSDEFQKREIDVVTSPLCRVESEFEEAVKHFEKEKVDLIVTIHLSYSPSLESINTLAATELPILVFDTTESYDFGIEQVPDEIVYNHGIHGVQDLCNMLKRRGKPFNIVVGHWEHSDAIVRAVAWARAARLASLLRNSRTGIIGEPFKGMGDFFVPTQDLYDDIGINTVHYDINEVKKMIDQLSESEIDNEIADIKNKYICAAENNDVIRRAVATGLAIRKWIKQECLTAFTVNFLSVDKKSGLLAMPFLEASLAMARGIGYAGEGDILTASLVGALTQLYQETSFAEMFCPNWKQGTIYFSHMGEMNPKLAAKKPHVVDQAFDYTDIGDTVALSGCFKAGRAVLLDLAPGPDDIYSLIISTGQMQDIEGKDKLKKGIHGWFKPSMPLETFLEQYSTNGGTHHIALVYDTDIDELINFGRIMGWNVILLN